MNGRPAATGSSGPITGWSFSTRPGRMAHPAQPGADGARGLVFPSLYPRALPLLRYAIGDLARPLDGQAQAVTAFASVVGRCNEVISLPDGTPVHSEAFTHVIRDVSGV